MTFTPSTAVAPAVNRTDVALGTISSFAPIEPMISVSPYDPGIIAASSHRGLRLSGNGGGSFAGAVSFVDAPGANRFQGDTDTAFDSQGRLYWVNISGTNNGSGGSDITVNRRDPVTGASISTRIIQDTAAADDKPFIAADRFATSPFKDNVYVVWTRFNVANTPVMFSRSTDQGLTWSVPIMLSGAGENFAWPTDVNVAANGDVYVAMHANGEGATLGRTLVRRSTNGGVSFGAATEAFTAGQSAVTYNVQTSTSTTIPGTQFWTQGTVGPFVLPDPARSGNVYVVTNDDPNNIYQNGDNADVVFARSTNNGASWTRTTIEAGPSNSFQLFPTAAIDEFGDIVVAWYDNRRGLLNASGRFKLDVFATYSVDGGLTWATPFMVNDASNPFDPDPGAANRFTGPPPTTRIGEYFGIDVYGGTAYVAWNGNSFSGSTPIGHQVWTDSFPLAGSVTVTGDDGVDPVNDQIIYRTISGNTASVEILVNGRRRYAGLLAGLSSVTLDGGPGNDTLTIDASANPLPISGASLIGGIGTDSVTFTGPGTAQTYALSDTSVSFASRSSSLSGFETVSAQAGSASDTFNVTPSSTAIFRVIGAAPASGPGDALNVTPDGAIQSGVVGPSGESGFQEIQYTNRLAVRFKEIETLGSGIEFAPTIGSLSDSPDPVITGQDLTLTANAVADANGGTLTVAFYHESNGIPGLQVGDDVSAGSDNSSPYALIVPAPATPGSYTYYAQAADPGNLTSNVVSTAVNVVSPLPAWVGAGSAATWNALTKVLTVTGATTIVDDPDADMPIINADGAAAVVTIAPSSVLRVNAASLNLSNGASATLASLGIARTASNHRVLVVNSISIDATSRMEVTDNDLIVRYTGGSPVAGVEADVRSGYNVTGDWQGNGITSSVAAADGNFTVAVADNAVLAAPFGTAQGGPLFAGVDVELTTVLVKFTHRADITLDGLVNPDDAAVFGTNYSENDFANWAIGDVDYDGLFTANDASIFGTFYDESLLLV